MTAKKPQADRLYAEREAALYDPDSLHRFFGLEETQGKPEQQAVSAAAELESAKPAPTPEEPALYAKAERRRAGAALTPEAIKRMADRAEQAGKKRRP